jgi:acetoin utilization deacetylase AcuC-like enzyme
VDARNRNVLALSCFRYPIFIVETPGNCCLHPNQKENRMKLSLLVAAMMAFALSACSKEEPAPAPVEQVAPVEQPAAVEEAKEEAAAAAEEAKEGAAAAVEAAKEGAANAVDAAKEGAAAASDAVKGAMPK